MSNINDYIKWRGDLKFSSKFKFNELDTFNIIFAPAFCYINYQFYQRRIEKEQ